MFIQHDGQIRSAPSGRHVHFDVCGADPCPNNIAARGDARPTVSLKFRICLIFFVCIAAQSISAGLPLARLQSIFPPGAKAGSTVEVTVTGVDLDDPAQLFFSSTNITGIPKPGEASKFLITVSSNMPAGIYDARFTGRFGISNPRSFVVSDLPELVEKDDNGTMAKAMEVPLGAIVNGHAQATAADYFRFSAKKGQRVLAECAAKAIDSRMDPTLMLYDGSGRELERNRRGGLLDFTVQADGQYVIKLDDMLFRGGAEYVYRLSVGIGPHLDYIFPPFGLPGTKSKFVLYGRNLPGGALAQDLKIDGKAIERLEVEIELRVGSSPASRPVNPAACVVDGIDYRLQTSDGSSNPILIGFASAPVVAEQEPNNTPAQGQKLTVPCDVVGQFHPAGDQDRFVFEAKKGQIFWAEVFSQRLGWPTSPFLVIQRVTKSEKGGEEVKDLEEVYGSDTNIGGLEFKTGTPDPASRFEVKEDGTYQIRIADLFNVSENNPRRLYRLSLRNETPDFRLVALAPAPAPAKKDAREASVWTPFVRRGETIPLKVLAFRRDNFNSEIQLTLEGLPPGVSYGEAKIEQGKTSTILLLTASDEAPNWAGPVLILGTARSPAGDIIRQAQGGSMVWDVGDYNTEPIPSRLTREVVFAVSTNETAPVSVAAAVKDGEGGVPVAARNRKVWEAEAGGKISIPCQVTRRGDFTEALKLKAAGIAALDSLKEIDVDSKATNFVLEVDLAKYKMAPGNYAFYLQTQTKGKYRNNPEGAQAADLAAKKAEKTAGELAAAAKTAADAFAAAMKTASDAEALAKKAVESLAAARTAEEKAPDNQELVAAKVSREKEASDTAAKAHVAAEAKTAAEKTSLEASAKAKEAEASKTASATRAKELAEKAKPKEVTVAIYSEPIRLHVKAEEKKVASDKKK